MPGPKSIPRGGKTAFDYRSGKAARHLRNARLRAEWNRKYAAESKGGGRKIVPYPVIGKDALFKGHVVLTEEGGKVSG